MNSELRPHMWLPEPQLAFHPERAADRSTHPLRGLLEFGPHSAGLVPDPIRVATLAPAGDSSRLNEFMRRLNSRYRPRERRDYVPEWPGFHGVFGLHMHAAGKDCRVELDSRLEDDFRNAPKPHTVLAERLTRAIHGLEARRSEFDVLFIYLPDRWRAGFNGGPSEDFNLHDHLKAATAARRIPIQLVRESRALAYPCRASGLPPLGAS